TQTSGEPVPFDSHVASPTFTPDKVGDYLFQVRVTDAAGNFSDDLVSVRANNVAPVLSNVAVTAVINEGGTVTISGDIFDAGSDALTVTVNWDEGDPEIKRITEGSTHFELTHIYYDDNPTGTPFDRRNISIVLSDDNGGSDSALAQVRVNNVAPVLSNVAVTPIIDENGIVTLTGNISDPGTQDTFDLFVNWGDVTQTYQFGAGATNFSVTHLYSDDNPTGTASDIQSIGLDLRDDDGGEVLASTSTTINNVAPLITNLAVT